MSVIKSKRGESVIQFLDTARELEVFTIRQASRFPKRFMFLITKDLVDLATNIYNDVKAANSILPSDKSEYLMRKDFINRAICGTQCLSSQLSIARELVKHSDNDQKLESSMWQTWGELVSNEFQLLKSLKTSDNTRYAELAK